MKCPHCGMEFKDPGRVAGGRVHSPSKGFGSPAVLDKAMATRRRNAEVRKRDKPTL